MLKIYIIILFFFLTQTIQCQPWYNKNIFENYIFSANLGTSMVLIEYTRDLNKVINEMRHYPKVTCSVGASKLFSRNWELGYEFELSTFHGFQNNPNFSAYHFGHFKISLMTIEPVIYKSHIQNHNFKLTYHINSKKEKRNIPYVFIKGGSTRLLSQLRYKSNNKLIFAKTGWDADEPKASIFVTEFNLGIGIGNEIIIDSKVSLNIQIDITNVNDDNLDGVHNFNAPPPEGYKNSVSGLYTRLMIGASYNINPSRDQKKSKKYRLTDSFNNKKNNKKIFPWISN